MNQEFVGYFGDVRGLPIRKPKKIKTVASRIALPILALVSRERSLKLGLTPIDDERVIMALQHTKGKLLDIGCGANNFVHSYGHGTGVDVYPWQGVDVVVEDAASLPFTDGSYGTVSFLACLNHIPNRAAALEEALRVLGPDGRLILTMIPPLWGQFIHWIRFKNDPDHKLRHIDHEHELMGMHATHVVSLMTDAGFRLILKKRFVYGINTIYVGQKI